MFNKLRLDPAPLFFQARRYLHFLLGAILLILLLHIFEFFILRWFNLSRGIILIWPLIKGIGNDMILLFRISLLLFPLFWILQIISRFAVITIEVLLLLSYTATTVFLLYYFGITGSLLDHVIIGYSNANAWHTMESYLRYAGWFLLLTAIICVLTIFVFRSVRKVKVNGKTGMILLLSIIILSYIIPLNLRNYTSVYTYSQKIAVNKIVYFIRDISNNNNNNTEYHYNNSVINNAVRKWHKQFPEKKFVSKEYPLLYKNNNNANPLEPFFKKTKEKVNVVVVILESIGREISGPDAPLESFTPFLDSLASQSLYWKNCLSTSERTFGVLPAFFGSLPYGKKGFLAMGNNMPWQYSLIRILNNNGYRSSFYYGGWTEFDNMATFFYRQGGDYVLDSFGQSYTKMDTIHDFCWGYGDRDVFRRSLEVIDSTEKSPRLDIYLTLSTHSPWIFLNQKTYIQKLRNYINKKGFSKSKKEDIWDQKARFSSILYADDAVRFLFNELKKRPDFNNTLFIVTGDHSMSLVPDNSLNRYHVPLIMYSPLLKRAGQFSGITSHMDITPGLLALLSNYGIKSPDTVHWMGTMIDTSMQFRNIETLPFMLNNRNISQLLYDSCYLDRDKLYSFDKSLSLHPLQNKKEFDKGVNILRTERIIHNTIPGLSRILPEELFLQNTSAKKILDISNKFTEAQQILPENQFFSIQSNAFPENQFQNLYVDFSFDYSFLDNRAGEFSLIMEILDKKGEKLVWQPWKTENTHGPTIWMTNHDSKYFFLKNLKPKEISSIKLYFWNNHDQSFRIRNFNLQIIAE